MYFGEFLVKVDDKGRITVPHRIRQAMEVHGHAVWYMTRGFDGCVALFHREEWDRVRKQIGKYPSLHAQALDFRRLFFSSMGEVRLDGQGRMAVPPHLRELGGIATEDEAVLIGVDDHLELWSKERWRAFQSGSEPGYKEMAALVSQSGDLAAVAGRETDSGE